MKRYVICLMSIFIFLFACGFDSEQQKVYDNADLLSEEEEESLNQMCIESAKEYEADFVIVTVDSLDGKTVTEYADDFYDYNGFGYEKEMGTGTLFLVAMDDRKCHFSTSGDCIDIFSQNASDQIVEEVTSYLSDGDYYDGFMTYIEKTGEYIKNGGKSNSQNILDILIEIVASLVVASATIWIMYSGSRSKMTVNGYTYASGHKSEVLQHHDVFQRTTTVRRHINNNPKGGSGVHVGSSGNSHGGSSGSF